MGKGKIVWEKEKSYGKRKNRIGKGKIAIDKSMVKTVVDSKIIIPLSRVLVGNQ
ncbi:MAG: hypothetical protein RBR63_11320 [Methanosarcina vacuolata]|jgi:hypothetical protein|nr:hypothetical protein [Methanosarcina vacuolata]